MIGVGANAGSLLPGLEEDPVSEALDASPRPRPRDFEDYRAFVRARAAWLREHTPNFSYRQFKRDGGFKTHTILKLVMEEERHIGPASVRRFAAGLRLAPSETDVFEALVRFQTARNDVDKAYWERRLQRLVPTGIHHLRAQQRSVYQHWFGPILLEMFGLPRSSTTAAALGRRLLPAVRSSAVQRVLDSLESLGLLVRDGGQLRAPDEHRTTGPQVSDRHVRMWHRSMLERLSSAVSELGVDERNITGMSLRLDPSGYQAALAAAADFRARIRDLEVASGTGARVEVYQVTLGIFPVTRRRRS